MTRFRSALFLIWFFGLTAVMAIAGLLVFALGKGAVAAYGRAWAGVMLFGARLICGLGYTTQGLEDTPKGAALIAAKHQSAFETLILPYLFPGACFILKKELMAIPIFGWHLKATGQIAVDRAGGAKALKDMVTQAKQAAAEGRKIIIFPEGTRTAPGESRAYHPGVAALYGALDIPVVPVALNSGLYWKRKAFLKLPGRAVLSFLPPIPAGLERRAFLAKLKDEIERKSAELLERG